MKIQQIQQTASRHGVDLATTTPSDFLARTGMKVSSQQLWQVRRLGGITRAREIDPNNKFRAAMSRKGCDAFRVAAETGVSYATICRWVHDGIQNIEAIATICEYLDVSPRDLV